MEMKSRGICGAEMVTAVRDLFIEGQSSACNSFASRKMQAALLKLRVVGGLALGLTLALTWTSAATAQEICPRPAPGSVVTEPENLRSRNGVLEVELTYSNFRASDGQEEYCYRS